MSCTIKEDLVAKYTKEFNPVETHPRLQVEGTPFEDFRILKYITPWKIKVPDGWSLLFLPPMNQFELSYIPLCGLVDSDTYDGVVNFPFICPNIGEGIHIHYKNFRFDLTIKDFLKFAEACDISLQELQQIYNQ